MMRIVPALLSGLLFLTCVARATSPPAPPVSLIRTLSPDEFTKAGLNKLTPEELAYLESTLLQHQQGMAQAAPVAPKETVVRSTDKAAAAFGAEQVIDTKRVITEQELHAHIEGTVESFSGRAVFVLDNGQIWQLRIPDTVYFTPKLENPEVIITRGMIGYKMVIVDANRVLFVKRIQ